MVGEPTPVAEELAASDWEGICQLALWLHAERDATDIQRGTLERLQRAIPHRASMFDFARVRPDGGIEFFSPASLNMQSQTLETYYRRFAQTDYTIWSFDMTSTTVYRDLDLVDAHRRDATPIYREWLEPMGVYFGCGATLASSGVPYGSVTLFREREAGDFTPREMRILLEVARHLSVRLADLFPSGMGERPASGDPVAELVAAHGVSPRESRVLRLMLEGRTNAQMAAELFISESTVKKHVNAIYRKLGVANRMELARLVSAG